MLQKLTANEARVIGCLMEKSIITPDQYPLTLTALTAACNQKSGRNPVMSLERGLTQKTVNGLRDKHLVHVEENFRSGIDKYRQCFCNTTYSDYQFDPPQFAIVCLLLLRGPQTPGELRAHGGRLHAFADNAAVVDALAGLMERPGGQVVVMLPRTPGRRDSEYMHLFFGPVDAYSSRPIASATPERVSVSELAQRISRLEAEVDSLREELRTLGGVNGDEVKGEG